MCNDICDLFVKMLCMSVRCCVLLEMYCFEHMTNLKMWNMILWLNLWDRWCYAMNGKMMWIVLSSAYYTYIVCVYVFIYIYLFRNMVTHSLCVACVWIVWWSQTLCSWEQMVRWMTLKNLVLENTKTQCSNRMWHWGISFYFN